MLRRRVLITGGAGFLGFHLAEAFRRGHTSVRLLDAATPPAWVNKNDVEYVQGDVRDREAVEAALAGVDAVVHAAFASPRQTRKQIHSVNVGGARTLGEVALARGISRVVLISSTIVDKPPRAHPILPNAPLSRLDAYRSSRAEAEEILGTFGSRGLSVAIARPKTFLGPGRLSAFAILFDWVRRGKPVLMLGPGTNRYQLLDIRDMAEGIRLLSASDATGVFFFGAREFGTVREDLQALIVHARSQARLRRLPAGLARAALRSIELLGLVPASEWHSMSAAERDSVVDTSRAEKELGWSPHSSNIQALCDAYDWYVETVMASGTAPTTHPLPLAHRILKGLISWVQK